MSITYRSRISKAFLDTRRAFHTVFSDSRYVFFTVVGGLILFSLNSLFRNYKILVAQFSFGLMWSLILGTFSSFSAYALVMLIVIAILASITLAFTIFLLRRQVAAGIAAGGGIVISLLAPACPSCALGLLSMLGLGSLLAFLPFKGLELALVGVGGLLFAVMHLGEKISTNVCELEK